MKRKTGFLPGLLVGILIGGAVFGGAYAASVAANPVTTKLVVDGETVAIDADEGYNINQNNFFKLRTIAEIFDIYVEWDAATDTAYLDSSKPYIDPNAEVTTGATLTNGMAVTEENVYAMLMELKEDERFAPDAPWGTEDKYDYLSPKFGAGGGCNSFAYTVSDLIFGTDAQLTTHKNYTEIKVGDVIWSNKGTGVAEHLTIVTEIDGDFFRACSGNNSDGYGNRTVSWSNWGMISLFETDSNTIIYTRYPSES